MRHPLQPHQLTDRVTRTDDAIVLCHLGVPRIDPNGWSLVIDGLVHRPLRLTLAELMRRPHLEITSVHQCCGSPLRPELPTRRVCNVVWRGARLADLIAECGPRPQARFLWSSGADYGAFEGVSCSAFVKDLPLQRIATSTMIAYQMNGEPLRPEHGFPARLVVPGYYGTNSVKWLMRMTLADSRAPGPFTTRWYNDRVKDASGQPTATTTPVWSIAPESLIVSPTPGQSLAAGEPVEVWGWTWGDGGIATVDVSDDGGQRWKRAAIEPPAGQSWRRFAMTWRPEPGGHELCARAQSADGRYQPAVGARNAMHRVAIKAA
jgi:DMSO/TMAO reductase YedYZ molybdopterin-dependent catalytic subunit